MKYLWHKGPFASVEIIRFRKSILAMTCNWIGLQAAWSGEVFPGLTVEFLAQLLYRSAAGGN